MPQSSFNYQGEMSLVLVERGSLNIVYYSELIIEYLQILYTYWHLLITLPDFVNSRFSTLKVRYLWTYTFIFCIPFYFYYHVFINILKEI